MTTATRTTGRMVDQMKRLEGSKPSTMPTLLPPIKTMPPIVIFTQLESLLATLLRMTFILGPLVLPLRLLFPTNWLDNPAFKSVLIRPHQTVEHLREVVTIQRLLLSTSTTPTQAFVRAYHANGIIRLPPLVLIMFSTLLEQDCPELRMGMSLLVVDLIIAYLIESLGNEVLLSVNPIRAADGLEEQSQTAMPSSIRPPHTHIFPITRQKTDCMLHNDNLASASQESKATIHNYNKEPLLSITDLPKLAAQLYYCSPITVLSGGYFQCFQNVSLLFLLASLMESIRRPTRGQRPRSLGLSAFLLAIATYVEPHHVIFLVPSILWAGQGCAWTCKRQVRYGFVIVVSFVFWTSSLHGLSYSLMGGSITRYWQILEQCYGYGWYHMRPNLSVIWYLHMQLFPRFRDYFGVMIYGLPYLAVLPLTIRLYNYPVALVAIFWLIFTVFRPVQTVFDLNVGLCLLLLSPRSLARMSAISTVALCSVSVPVILFVLDYWMWLETGSGNANYMFFQCFAYNGFIGILVGQFCSASVQRDKAVQLTAKYHQTKKTQTNMEEATASMTSTARTTRTTTSMAATAAATTTSSVASLD